MGDTLKFLEHFHILFPSFLPLPSPLAFCPEISGPLLFQRQVYLCLRTFTGLCLHSPLWSAPELPGTGNWAILGHLSTFCSKWVSWSLFLNLTIVVSGMFFPFIHVRWESILGVCYLIWCTHIYNTAYLRRKWSHHWIHLSFIFIRQ